MKCKLQFLMMIAIFSIRGYSQQSAPLNSPEIIPNKFIPNSNRELTIPRHNNQKIVIDGNLDEEIWNNLQKSGNFSEVSPGDNTKPEVETEVMSFYDENNLYFGFICYEKDITKIRKTLCARDKIFQDDFCGIIIDTYSEAKNAYELFINPYGIQGDLMWQAPGNEDATFDAIWYSAGKIYDDRWTVEIAIPFKSIRFPNKEIQEWNFHMFRNRPRENRYQYCWLPISRDDATLFTKTGKLKGIENIKGGENLEFLPYFLSSQTGSIADNSDANSNFNNEKIKGNVGFNLKYGITSNLTADFTYNPDFSQIEADPGTISVNNTYALFFPEKRPFFLEGANIFNAPGQLIYTRTINNPSAAFKVTGKIDKTEIGFITAYDKKTPVLLPFEEYSDFIVTDRKSLSNILRLKQTIKNESYIGFYLTDREINKEGNDFINNDGYNRVFGIDGQYRFLDNYSFQFMLLRTLSKEINYSKYENSKKFSNDKYSAALDGESFSGNGGYIGLNRSARFWNFNIEYTVVPPTARLDNGFLNSNDANKLSMYHGYTFWFENSQFLRIQPFVGSFLRHNTDGKLREIAVEPGIEFALKNQINFSIQYLLVNNEQFGGIYNKNANRIMTNFNSNTFDFINFNGNFNYGKFIIRSDNPSVGFGLQIGISASLKLYSNLIIGNNYNYFELSKSKGGERLYAGYILRNTINYQIMKDFNLRMISEYNKFSNSFYLNPLLSYQPDPFTIFYIGSTQQYNEMNQRDLVTKYTLSERQFFLKLQYLFRI